MRVTLQRIKRPASFFLILLLIVHFLMLILLLLMGVSVGSAPPPVEAQDRQMTHDKALYKELSAQLLKSSPCQGVNPGHLSSWQPVFIVVITANPSTTDVHSFAFLRCCLDNKFILQKEDSYIVHRSIVSYAKNNRKLRSLLNPLLQRATNFVPNRFRKFSPIIFRATFTLRNLVSRKAANRLVFRVRSTLRTSPFKVKSHQVTIMEKSDEAADLWLSAAFLTGRLYADVSSPLAVADLEGGTLRVAVPLTHDPLRRIATGAFVVDDFESAVGEEESKRKRSRRTGRSGKNFRRELRSKGDPYGKLEIKKGSKEEEVSGEGNGGSYNHSISEGHVLFEPLSNEGGRTPPIAFKRALFQGHHDVITGSRELPKDERNITAADAIYDQHSTVTVSRSKLDETSDTRSNFNDTEKLYYKNYLNKTLKNYSRTSFVSDVKEKIFENFENFIPASEFDKNASFFDRKFKEKRNIVSDNVAKASKYLNVKVGTTRYDKRKKVAKNKFNERRQPKMRFKIKRKRKKKRNTQFLLNVEMDVVSPDSNVHKNLGSILNEWCKYEESSASKTKRFNSSVSSNLDKSSVSNVTSLLRILLDSHCSTSKSGREGLFLTRNNESRMYVKRGQKMAVDSKFHNHQVNTQIHGRNMHRKLERRRSDARLLLPDNISKEEKEKKEEEEEEEEGEEGGGEKKKANDGEESSLKNPVGDEYKRRGCNEIKDKGRQTYCQTNSGLFSAKKLISEGGERNEEATIRDSSKRRERNRSLSKLHFKRKRRKNKSYNELGQSRRSSQTNRGYFIGRRRKSRGRKGRRRRKRRKTRSVSAYEIQSRPIRVKYRSDSPENGTGESNPIQPRTIGLNPVSSRHFAQPSSIWRDEWEGKKEKEEGRGGRRRRGDDDDDDDLIVSNRLRDAAIKPSKLFVNSVSVKASRKPVSEAIKRDRRKAPKNLRLSANITFRCSPSKKFWLYATSFPLGIYPARVSVLLGGNSTSNFGKPFKPSSVLGPPTPTLRPPRRRSDIPPEEEYNLNENDSAFSASIPPPKSSLTPPPRSSLTPPPEPRGPGPPSRLFPKHFDSNRNSTFGSSPEFPETFPARFPKGGEKVPSSDGSNGETTVVNSQESLSNGMENFSGNAVDGFVSNSSMQTMWTMDTLEKVKTVVDSVLRAIGSVRKVDDEKPKRIITQDAKSPRKTEDENRERKSKKKVSSRLGRKRKIMSDFKSKRRKARRKQINSLVNNNNNNNNNNKLSHRRNSSESFFPKSIRSESLRIPHQKAIAQTFTNESNSNHSLLNIKNLPSSKRHKNDSNSSVAKAGAISSVTDLLFTVPNLRVIKPIENSRVDSAIKSTEKLVLTSLTDLLYSVPSRPEKNNTDNSSDSNRPNTNTANTKAFPIEGLGDDEQRRLGKSIELLTKPFDEMIIKSSCIPVGSRGKFTINDVSYVVIGRKLTNRTNECWKEVTKIVEKYIKIPTVRQMDFLATTAFYFVAASANLIESNSSAGYVRPSQFQKAADEICSQPSEQLPDPLVCLDYQFVAALLLKGFKLPPEEQIMVCDYLGGFGLSSALGTALNYLQGH